jgi:Ribonuclease G/E
MNFLFNLWLDIRQKAEKEARAAAAASRSRHRAAHLRDQFTDDFKAIWVDNEELYESVLRFVQRFQPSLVTRVKLYTRPSRFSTLSTSPRSSKKRCGRRSG